ncbi:hypothetical protein CGLO_17269 [Colletotrichum gloeosporioides Cg-14]|uniref:Uncharacterized protein n=1 Tax=Colletotrichum gloeosporioides (strain Cg-14) TaxID=1237896 RepID=T0JLG9_COLGC|nr:hypothetical protein CGLO_17269 [Colletotrichum gloeosporioides Cg-14]
MVLKTDSSA